MKGPAPNGSAARARTGRDPQRSETPVALVGGAAEAGEVCRRFVGGEKPGRSRRPGREVTAPALRRHTALLALVLATAAAWGQEEAEPSELDRVLAAHYEALGGLERLRAVSVVRGTATMAMPDVEAAFTVVLRAPNQMRMDGDFGGMALIRAFDGEQAWAQQPGEIKPVVLGGDLAAVAAADADVTVRGLVDLEDRGYRIELAGRQEIESGEAWKLLVTAPSGVVQQVFIGVEDGLERKRVAQVDLGFGLQETATLFDDFREVDGLVFAHRHTMSSPMGEMPLQFESFEIDPEIDPDIFFLPGQTADASLDLAAILERHRAARGGSAGDVQSLRASGTVVLLGFEVPMRMAFVRPDSFRIDIDLQGLSMVLAYDGETAWNVSPMQGVVDPTPLPEEMGGAVSILSDFLWGLLGDVEARGLEVTLAGVEKVERDETYRLDVAPSEGDAQPDGMARTLHLGGEDFLERLIAFDGSFLGSTGRVEVTLADYRDVGGLQIPGKIRIAVDGAVAAELRVGDAEANVDVDAASFTMPAPADPDAPGPAA